jgi:hypothetical protein
MTTSKKDAKATANEEATEQTFLAKQAKKPKAQAAEEGLQPREGEEFLPPPDPPAVPSPPTEPPAPDEVDPSEKGAHPEDEAALRELDLVVEGVRGVGPIPEDATPKEEGE